MKILHYINDLGPGGAERLLTDILPLIKEEGHDVHLVYSNNKINFFNYHLAISDAGVKVTNLNIAFFNPVHIVLLIKLMRKEQYDIIHAHLFPTQYWLAIASFFKPRKTRLIKTEHNVFNHRRKYYILSFLEKIIYARYSKIIAITDEVKLSLGKWLKNQKQIIVIHNGIWLEKINSFKSIKELPGNQINIFMAARFRLTKDQNTLIHASKLLPENYHIYFAGDGALLQNSKNLAGEINVDNRVHFLGNRTDVISLMKQVDLNVLSTNYEGLSTVALESLASGKPFIGSDVRGVNDVVPCREFLFPAGNVEKLAEKIKSIIENKDMASEMVATAINHVKNFDVKKMVENYLKVYAESIET